MNEHVSPATSAHVFPRILIAENKFSTVESLIETFRDRRLDFDFHLCTSRDGAVRKLMGTAYQAVISDAHLAEKDCFSLLRQTQASETFVPLLVTAEMTNAQERESARRY
jgi:DNA-binding response OmpR family regulator